MRGVIGANQLLCHVMTTQITQAGCCWKIWSWKYACEGCAVRSVWTARWTRSSLCREENSPTYFEERFPLMCTCTDEHTCTRLMESDVWSQTLAYATMNNALTVLIWLHNWVRTPYVKACVISAHFSGTVWKEIATLLPLPPFFFLSALFHSLLCAFVLDDQAVGWSVWPRRPLRLGWRKFTNG